MLLRFRVTNHRSFRDSVELSLVPTRNERGGSSDWTDQALAVVGIYGPNASGKSTLLNALEFMTNALRHSATQWAESDAFPHQPFLLDEESASTPSEYELDFTHRQSRYNYGFTSSPQGIQREWLYSYPHGRRRILFAREGQDFTFGRGVVGSNQALASLTKSTVLFLALAGTTEHKTFGDIHHRLTRHIKFAKYSESDRGARLRMLRDALADPNTAERIRALVAEADLGITEVKAETREVPDDLMRVLTAVWESTRQAKDDRDESGPTLDEFVERASHHIAFGHSAPGGVKHLPMELESTGTIAWLSLALPALRALRYGDTLLVDEIDSSLHPRLTAALISMFQEAERPARAQLIFTSHDTSLLGPLTQSQLGKDCVWFAEKRADGTSDLYALAEFSPRSAHNVERRYLQGRYGAVPMVSSDSLSYVAEQFDDPRDAPDHDHDGESSAANAR